MAFPAVSVNLVTHSPVDLVEARQPKPAGTTNCAVLSVAGALAHFGEVAGCGPDVAKFIV